MFVIADKKKFKSKLYCLGGHPPKLIAPPLKMFSTAILPRQKPQPPATAFQRGRTSSTVNG